MRLSYLFIASLLPAAIAAATPRGIDSIVDALADMPGYGAEVTYAVTLPQAEDDVVYTVELQQPAANDYLIEWNVESPSGPVSGFTAWFDGHFYNFRNRRLQEVHSGWDKVDNQRSAPQNSVQFASLLPSRIAMQLSEIAHGPYSHTVSERNGEITVSAIRNAAGQSDAELEWKFDAQTLMPRSFYADYNPGAISGQQVKAEYAPMKSQPVDSLSEEMLRQRYAEAFSRYRESTFAIENMRGEPLPGFSLPLAGGGRLERSEGQSFPQPTAVVLFDPLSPLTPQLVASVRGAIDRLPLAASVIWAGTSKNPDVYTEVSDDGRTDETLICGSQPLATDCGASALPVILVCGTDGRITDLVNGLNNTLETDVIRMLTTPR